MAGIKRIAIDQQLAELGIQTTQARLKIDQPRMKMRISTETPQMEIQRVAPKFRINRRKLNADMNIYAPGDFTKKNRDEGKATVLRGIKRNGDEGDFLGNAKIRGSKVGQLARNKAMTAALKKKESNIGLLPRERPEITWDKGSMSINWSKHSLVIDWDGDYMPQVTIDPKYNIEFYLRTEPYFKITVEEVAGFGGTGQYLDSAI